jgi:uncharacterized protein YprB with RNaseH-like and TPR domain
MDSDALFDKLKSLGVHLGASQVTSPGKRQENNFCIENVVNGFYFSTMFGQAFITRQIFPLGYRHGDFPVFSNQSMDVLAAWSHAPRIVEPGGQNIVFLDTETSGLNGGTGTYAFLIGLGYRTETEFELVQLFMRDPSEEAALLAALDEWLSRFNVVVTFNGKSFDIPLLNTRYQINGLSSPFVSYQHVDVLQVARKLWRDRLASRALGDLEKEIVQFDRTAEDVPGWLIPQLYFDYLHTGDSRPLSGVFYHNSIDILSLATLFGAVASLIGDPLHKEKVYGLDLAAIARLYEEMGWFEQAAGLYERSLEQGDLPEEFFLKTIERYAHLHKRQNKWESALALWQMGAEHGMVAACVELSKFYEHRERNYSEALNWARKALENLERMDIFDYPNKSLEADIQMRIGRLFRRMYRGFDEYEK